MRPANRAGRFQGDIIQLPTANGADFLASSRLAGAGSGIGTPATHAPGRRSNA